MYSHHLILAIFCCTLFSLTIGEIQKDIEVGDFSQLNFT
jgi:hypothetical protein